MTANKVRSDYNALAGIAKSFGSEAGTTRQTLNNLKSKVATLQGGQWVGKNADKFYAEWSGEVMPALNRLINALETAQRVTTQVSQRVKQAEDEAAAVLRGDGGGGGKGDGAVRGGPAAPGPSGGDGGSSGGGSSSSGGSSSGGSGGGSASPGPGGGSGSGGSGSGGSGGSGSTGVQKALSQFDPKVRELVEKSPTLKAQIEKLEKAGWTVKLDPTSTGYFTDHQNKTIVIDGGTSAEQVGKIAHEVGHANLGDTYIPPTATTTRDQFVNGNVDAAMLGEGEAQLNAAIARDEIRKAGGTDPGIPGGQTADYQKVYDDYKANKITRAEAVKKMGDLMGNEDTSTTGQKYRDYYVKSFQDFWDKKIAPTRKKP